jgi:fructokinase
LWFKLFLFRNPSYFVSPMNDSFLIVGAGEALFDIIRGKPILGGAPLNVAVHVQQLSARLGGRGGVLSRVGQDDLGQKVIQELKRFNVDITCLQTDPDKKTGRVFVSLDDDGKPTYEIVEDVAWDWLQFDPDLEGYARRCDAICFGTLAQRNPQSRSTLQRVLDVARQAIRLFDVNLRQHYFNADILTRNLELSTSIKLNEAELPIVCQTLGIGLGEGLSQEQMSAALLKRFKLRHLILTRGARGTVLQTPTARFEGKPASYPRHENADDVGAGDSCSAAVLIGLVRRWPGQKVVDLANQVGAFVASQPGATPTLPPELVDQFVD